MEETVQSGEKLGRIVEMGQKYHIETTADQKACRMTHKTNLLYNHFCGEGMIRRKWHNNSMYIVRVRKEEQQGMVCGTF
jgi:hypothetical protein